MAEPIIDNITVVPSVISPGGKAVLTIMAHDPDDVAASLKVAVTDSEGNEVFKFAPLPVKDDLSYAVEDTDGVGFTIVQRPAEPNVFDITAP